MQHDRRRFLKLSGIAALGATAGCTTSTQGSDATTAAETDAATATPSGTGASFDFGGWLADTDNYDGTTVDARGQSEVTIEVGAAGNGGDFTFSPPAVWVDPGTTVTWEWTGNGGAHNVVADTGADFRSGDPTDDGSTTFGQTVDEDAVIQYFCSPHQSLGMRGAIVVGDATPGESQQSSYGWQAATFDSYWYSLYNMSTNIAMSGNGVIFPHTPEQQDAFEKRIEGITKHADVDRPPINNPNLNMVPFTGGDPHFTQKPVFEDDTGRPDAKTLAWDKSKSTGVVSPSSTAWSHLKGVTWAKNFQKHFDTLPQNIAPKFRAQVLTTLAQLGTKATLIDGGPDGNGALTAGDDSLKLVSEFRPKDGTVVDGTARPSHHTAMLWFLSDLVSLAKGGWFGYENPEPLIPATNIQKLADGTFKTTRKLFSPPDIVDAESTRSLGLTLAAVGWYGTHAGRDQLQSMAADYADALAMELMTHDDGNGRIANGAANQAATQGIVGQGLLWASEIDGVDHAKFAESTLGFLFDELWDGDAGTFASGADDSTYAITARDAGDVTGGLNAADAVLGRSDVKDTFAQFFQQTFNRGRLQRAERPPSHSGSAEHPLPLPPKAGGQYGQAATYNTAVEYDPAADEWAVTDPAFDTEQALYLANQDIWIGNWGGDFYQGRGVPGKSDSPPS
ncbi:halocyanin domain-containing protein [Haloarculaceae archaeon H-GB2-1]|nr:halocyanin domain-containing protein [Haloarculaceae archaeon H-GB1-1]MEA5406777.1 halocyanin domain-containing protein [Haloarculaceae archaeon H-GB2-1]